MYLPRCWLCATCFLVWSGNKGELGVGKMVEEECGWEKLVQMNSTKALWGVCSADADVTSMWCSLHADP